MGGTHDERRVRRSRWKASQFLPPTIRLCRQPSIGSLCVGWYL